MKTISKIASQKENRPHFTVWLGWVPGVYRTRKELDIQLKGFKGALYYQFPDKDTAQWAFEIGYTAWKSGQQRYKSTPLF